MSEGVLTILAPILSEREFEAALSGLCNEQRLAWLSRFKSGFEAVATEQKAALAAALSSTNARRLRAA